MSDLFDLSGRIAIVTGGGRGIGKMITKGLIEAGAKVYISSRKADVCDEAANELGDNCVSLPADLSSEAGAATLAAEFSRHENQLDILVNNAGVAWSADFDDVDEKSWDKVMNVNLKAPFFVTQKLRPLLKKSVETMGRPAKVINIASIDGITLNAQEVYAYHGSKGGVIVLSRRMAARLVEDGIYVNSISPGAFASDMNVQARDNPELSVGAIPVGRIGAQDDIVGAITFLAARAGDYVVGQNLVLDGGVAGASFRTHGKHSEN